MAKKFRILFIFMALSLSLCIMSNTYSRYVADATGNVEVLFAKWQILLNNDDITNNSASSITLTPVMEENQYIADNTVAPSSKGYFDIDIDASNVQLSYDFSISLAIANENMPDLMITKYAILDNTYVDGDLVTYNTINNGLITGTEDYDKTAENFKFEPYTIRVYFEWYEGADEQMDDTADTLVGNTAAIDNTTFNITANINFEQKM